MRIVSGNRVNVDGAEAVVEGSWGQGAHKAFKLSDGRVVLDLDKLVESGKATIVQVPEKKILPPTTDKKWNL